MNFHGCQDNGNEDYTTLGYYTSANPSSFRENLEEHHIIGITIGGTLFFLCVALMVYMNGFRKRKRRVSIKEDSDPENNENRNGDGNDEFKNDYSNYEVRRASRSSIENQEVYFAQQQQQQQQQLFQQQRYLQQQHPLPSQTYTPQGQANANGFEMTENPLVVQARMAREQRMSMTGPPVRRPSRMDLETNNNVVNPNGSSIYRLN